AAIALFAGLKDEMHGAFEIARLGEIACRAQQHRRVPVMAAGMHQAVMGRAVREIVVLLHRQAVYIGSESDRAQRIAAPDRADNAGLGKPTMHLAAIFGELLRDEIAGPLLGEAELRMRMDVAADLGQLIKIVEDLGDYWHAGSGGLGSRGRERPAYRLARFRDSRFANWGIPGCGLARPGAERRLAFRTGCVPGSRHR